MLYENETYLNLIKKVQLNLYDLPDNWIQINFLDLISQTWSVWWRDRFLCIFKEAFDYYFRPGLEPPAEG